MRILVVARHILGDAKEGGSSRFFKVVIDALKELGHEVVATNIPATVINEKFDLIICSHFLNKIQANPAPKIYISHGIITEELFKPGADRYISISEEVRRFNLKKTGIDSEVIPQPIKIMDPLRSGDELKKILIIRQNPIEDDPFACLFDKYDVRVSDIEKPIEDQIYWADLVISLGRGALEAFAQGKPVIVADKRHYMAAIGDGYVSWENITQMAQNNFSGRRYAVPITDEWLEREVGRYHPDDAGYLYKYVSTSHDAKKIVQRYLHPDGVPKPITHDYSGAKLAFGAMVNDLQRCDMVLRQSAIEPGIQCHIVKNPESATKGLNLLLEIMENEGDDIGVLCHQDMYFRQGWTDKVKKQLSLLPESWVVAGIIGKDMDGIICGKFQDMRCPLRFNTSHLHEFPSPVCCFDECCLIFNLKKKFRFDESFDGFDLYGTLCVLQAWESDGTAWIIDAYAEHYCMRRFDWVPDETFKRNYKRLFDKYDHMQRVDSTAVGLPREKVAFFTSAA